MTRARRPYSAGQLSRARLLYSQNIGTLVTPLAPGRLISVPGMYSAHGEVHGINTLPVHEVQKMQLYDVDMTEVTYHSNMENVAMAIVRHRIGERSLSLRLLLACGIIGPPLFIVVFLIEGTTR